MQRKITREEMQRLYADKKYEDRVAFMFTAQNEFFEPGAGGLKQVIEDYYYRTFVLNDHHNMGLHPSQAQLSREEPRHSDQEILDQLKLIIGTANDELVGHFIEAHSQGIATFVPMILGNGTEDRVSGNITEDSLIIRQPQGSQKISVRVEGGDLYLSATFDQFDVVRAGNDKEILGVFTGPVTTTYKLAQKDGKWAYELMYVETDNEDIIRLMQGELLTSQELIEKYCPLLHLQNEIEMLELVEASNEENKRLKKNAVAGAKRDIKTIAKQKDFDQLSADCKQFVAQIKGQRKIILDEEAKIKLGAALLALENLYQEVNKKQSSIKDSRFSSLTSLLSRKVDPDQVYDAVMQPLIDAYNAVGNSLPPNAGADDMLPHMVDLLAEMAGQYKKVLLNQEIHQFIEKVAVEKIATREGHGIAAYSVTMLSGAMTHARTRLTEAQKPAEVETKKVLNPSSEVTVSATVQGQDKDDKDKEEEKDDLPSTPLKKTDEPEEDEPVVMVSVDEEARELDLSLEDDAFDRANVEVQHDDFLDDAGDEPEAVIIDLDDADQADNGEMVARPVIPYHAGIHDVLPVAVMHANLARITQALSVGDHIHALSEIYALSANIDKLKPWMKGKSSPADANQFLLDHYGVMPVDVENVQLHGAILQDAIFTVLEHYARNNNREMITEMQQPHAAMMAFAQLVNIDLTASDYDDRDVRSTAKLIKEYCEEKVNQEKLDMLDDACLEYMKHLGRQMYEGLLDGDFDLCKQLVVREGGKRIFKLSMLMDIVDVNNANIKNLRARNESFDMAIRKYQAVREMRNTLVPGLPLNDRLQKFETAFRRRRDLIEQRRDSGAMIFLKVLATIFTVGIAALAGLWKVKGKQFADDIDKQLPDDNKPGGNKNK